MKPFKKILILCVAFVLMATKVLAGDVVIVKKLNGVVSSDAGNVEAVVNEAVCTLTVTPAVVILLKRVVMPLPWITS